MEGPVTLRLLLFMCDGPCVSRGFTWVVIIMCTTHVIGSSNQNIRENDGAP
jgi:hypothetical protein